MANSDTFDAEAFVIPRRPNRLSTLHPLAARALEELLLFYAGRNVGVEEFGRVSKVGVLELVHCWVDYGNAVTVLDTYEKYLTAVGEIVAVYDGQLTDLLTRDETDVRGSLAGLLVGIRPLSPRVTLHPAVQRETYERAQKRRKANYEPL